MSALLLLAVLAGMPVHVTPAEPTVGDPVTIVFPEAPAATVRLEPSPDYEVVSVERNRAVVRTFRPGPLSIRGSLEEDGRVRFFPDLRVEIRSVLGEEDSLEPAPLRPPRELPPNRIAWAALGLAGLAAIALWFAVLRVRESPAPQNAPPARLRLSPSAELLGELDWIEPLDKTPALLALGGAVRRFLSRVDAEWGLDRSSRELRRELAARGLPTEMLATIDSVLLEADLEKFSPWGAPEIDRHELVAAARELARLDAKEEPS